MDVIDWLLDSDPAVRWQVLRDVAGAPAAAVATERARVATEGWGAQLLELRGDDRQWAGGACFPADFRGDFSAGCSYGCQAASSRLFAVSRAV